jgi:polysaccharide export outer membrane protein
LKKTAVLAMLVAIASCAGMQKRDAGEMTSDATQEEGYKFGPDDIIHVVVEDHPEWSGEFIVKPDGNIVIPNYAEIKVVGMTKTEVRQTLVEGMSKYLNNPKVAVDTVKYVSQVIYVLGSVNRPGEYPTAGKQITLKDAIVLAGLPSLHAVTTRVYVISPAGRRPTQTVINLDRILYHGETGKNMMLHAGDIVYVPKSIFGKIADFFSSFFNPITTSISTAGVIVP